MSSYHKLPRARKIASRQHGLKRIALTNRSAVGCPKVFEIWIHDHQWHNIDASDFLLRAKEACGQLLQIPAASLDVEF